MSNHEATLPCYSQRRFSDGNNRDSLTSLLIAASTAQQLSSSSPPPPPPLVSSFPASNSSPQNNSIQSLLDILTIAVELTEEDSQETDYLFQETHEVLVLQGPPNQ